MAKAKAVKEQLLKNSQLLETRRGDDTIRIWESYRDQALLWRALALLQIPATFAAVILAFVIWQTRSVTLNVPARPQPGLYAVQQIPDVEFIETATEFINLIASYQPLVARRQYRRAAEMTKEPYLAEFRRKMLDKELRAIETTSRTQLFFVDPLKTEVLRTGNQVHVALTGTRLKIISGKELPVIKTEFVVTMATVPKTELNPYGIVVSNMSFDNIEN